MILERQSGFSALVGVLSFAGNCSRSGVWFKTVSRRSRLLPGISIRTSLRALATSRAASAPSFGVSWYLVMVGHLRIRASNTFTLEIFCPAMTAANVALRSARASRDVCSTALPFFLMCYGPEFIAKAVQTWIATAGAQTAYITPSSLWENGHIESFNARLRDEFLNGEIFYTLQEVKILIEAWRRQDNTIRPHSSLGYRPPAPEVLMWPAARLSRRPAVPATSKPAQPLCN